MRFGGITALCLLWFCCFALASNRKTLVILDDLSMKNTHSMFFKSLTDRGYDLSYYRSSDAEIPFRDNDEFQYDSLIVFAPSSDNWNEMDISVHTVLEFIDNRAGNVLIAGDANVSTFPSIAFSAMADECGAEFGSIGNYVIDHLSYDQSDASGYHTVIAADNFVNSAVLSRASPRPVLYQGNGMSLKADNRLVFPILSGSSSSYCQNPEDFTGDSLHVSGQNVVLVAGLQARNNARVVISGSVDMFSDKYFSSEIVKVGSSNPSGNAEFATDISQWVFGERGLIRVVSVDHHLVGETESRSAYTVKETIVYTMLVEEYNGKEWVGYVADDIQLDIQMLDPYIRKNLIHQGDGVYSATIRLPDVYGVFTFKVDYHRVGYTSLEEKQLVTILPLRHTDYERFIPSAFPYYASAFSMMGGIALFSLVFLFSK